MPVREWPTLPSLQVKTSTPPNSFLHLTTFHPSDILTFCAVLHILLPLQYPLDRPSSLSSQCSPRSVCPRPQFSFQRMVSSLAPSQSAPHLLLRPLTLRNRLFTAQQSLPPPAMLFPTAPGVRLLSLQPRFSLLRDGKPLSPVIPAARGDSRANGGATLQQWPLRLL